MNISKICNRKNFLNEIVYLDTTIFTDIDYEFVSVGTLGVTFKTIENR